MKFLTPERIRGASGLRPTTWFVVGAGYSREDLKDHLLAQGPGFVASAVMGLDDLALKLVGATKDLVLGPAARQEVLRLLLSVRDSSSRMPELNRLRRQSRFYRRLDQAIQAGRLCFAHDEEAQVLADRLTSNPVRVEISRLAAAYESWLEASGLYDSPSLVARATGLLDDGGWPAGMERPRELVVLSSQAPESRERALWEAISRQEVQVERVGPELTPGSAPRVSWELWHTADDAADRLADRLLDPIATAGTGPFLEDDVILLHDAGEARRSLFRALAARGIPLADPRDPTRIRWDEEIKRAMLPLEVVARDFDRERVIAWLQAYCGANPDLVDWVEEIQARGIRHGLAGYQGGALTEAYRRLRALDERLGGKRGCAELAEAHLALVRASVEGHPERAWLAGVFEAVWESFARDTARIGQGERRAPALHWFERLQARLEEAASPAPREKSESGARIYRLHQAPLVAARRVWVLGLPPGWLSGESMGDAWWSERDRETLSSEFGVRSGIQVRDERLASIGAWITAADEVIFIESSHDPSGRERESIQPVLREIAESLVPAGVTLELPEAPESHGAHPRWLASYGALRPVAPLDVELAPLPAVDGALPEIRATALDAYSRCGFMALGYHRWKLSDLREPDAEPWPEVRGNILHEAVRVLVEARDDEGSFSISTGEALDRAWAEVGVRGMLRGKRIEAYARHRMKLALDAFCEKEREYVARARTKPISLDNRKFRYETPAFTLVGTPDRIDEHPDGLFIIDYKSSSASGLPSGTDMIELSYRLQLPFYALAVARETGKRVLGVQFVELQKKADRGKGIFFVEWNGKEPGRLTKLIDRSKSLVAGAPEDAWGRLESEMLEQTARYVAGRFSARPRKGEKECRTCRVADLCGFRRLSPETTEEGA